LDYIKPFDIYFNLYEQQTIKPSKINQDHLLYNSVILTMANLQNILKTELDPSHINEKESYLKTFRTLIEELPDFFLNNILLLREPNSVNNETNTKIINILISGMQTIPKLTSQLEDSYAFIQELFLVLINKALKTTEEIDYLLGIILNIVIQLPDKLKLHVSHLVCWQKNVWEYFLRKYRL